MYVVINKHGEVFAGLRRGHYTWSDDWSKAKPLYKENTTLLLEENKHSEIIKETDLL